VIDVAYLIIIKHKLKGKGKSSADGGGWGLTDGADVEVGLASVELGEVRKGQVAH